MSHVIQIVIVIAIAIVFIDSHRHGHKSRYPDGQMEHGRRKGRLRNGKEKDYNKNSWLKALFEPVENGEDEPRKMTSYNSPPKRNKTGGRPKAVPRKPPKSGGKRKGVPRKPHWHKKAIKEDAVEPYGYKGGNFLKCSKNQVYKSKFCEQYCHRGRIPPKDCNKHKREYNNYVHHKTCVCKRGYAVDMKQHEKCVPVKKCSKYAKQGWNGKKQKPKSEYKVSKTLKRTYEGINTNIKCKTNTSYPLWHSWSDISQDWTRIGQQAQCINGQREVHADLQGLTVPFLVSALDCCKTQQVPDTIDGRRVIKTGTSKGLKVPYKCDLLSRGHITVECKLMHK